MENLIDITSVLEATLMLAVALITAFLLPWLKRKISAEKLQALSFWVTVAVEAAEERYAGSPGCGVEKFNYVVSFLQERGYKLDGNAASGLINSAVWELINRFKEPVPEEYVLEGTE